jgi:hypothetical protein
MTAPVAGVVDGEGLARHGLNKLAIYEHLWRPPEEPCRVAESRIEFKRVHVHSSRLKEARPHYEDRRPQALARHRPLRQYRYIQPHIPTNCHTESERHFR